MRVVGRFAAHGHDAPEGRRAAAELARRVAGPGDSFRRIRRESADAVLQNLSPLRQSIAPVARNHADVYTGNPRDDRRPSRPPVGPPTRTATQGQVIAGILTPRAINKVMLAAAAGREASARRAGSGGASGSRRLAR